MSRRHNDTDKENFAAKLRAYRQKNNITQEGLARLLETSVFSVNRWEKAKHYPNASVIKLMKMLKILS